jgi:hypothetical protein
MTTGNGDGNGHQPTGLDWLRARHDELAQDRTMDYPVPGYSGRLVLRFGLAPWKALAKIQNIGPGDDGTALLNVNADVLIAACRAVLVRDDEGALVSIDPEGQDVRIDKKLADLLDTGTASARETLAWLFPSEVAIGVCASELLQWTQGTDREVTEDFIKG